MNLGGLVKIVIEEMQQIIALSRLVSPRLVSSPAEMNMLKYA